MVGGNEGGRGVSGYGRNACGGAMGEARWSVRAVRRDAARVPEELTKRRNVAP